MRGVFSAKFMLMVQFKLYFLPKVCNRPVGSVRKYHVFPLLYVPLTLILRYMLIKVKINLMPFTCGNENHLHRSAARYAYILIGNLKKIKQKH